MGEKWNNSSSAYKFFQTHNTFSWMLIFKDLDQEWMHTPSTNMQATHFSNSLLNLESFHTQKCLKC